MSEKTASREERSVLYNEIDPFAAAWLRNLAGAGHVAAGPVDERSIAELLTVARADPDLRVPQIAERFGRSRRWISELLAAHGLSRKPEGLRSIVWKRKRS